MPYSVVLIGAGMMGKILGDAAQNTADMNLVGYCDIDGKKKIYNHIPFFDDYKDMIQKISPEIALIATPNATHENIIMYCIDNGIHIACEKPLTTTYETSKKLIEYAYSKNCILETIYHRSFNINIRDIWSQGNIKTIHVNYLENIADHSESNRYLDKIMSGGGCIIDNGINVLDILTRLCPDFVYTSGEIGYNKALPGDIESKSTIELSCSSTHITATIHLDRHYPGEKKDITIVHTDETITYRDMLAGYPGFKSSLVHEYRAYMQQLVDNLHAGYIEKDSNTIKNMELLRQIYKNIYLGKK